MVMVKRSALLPVILRAFSRLAVTVPLLLVLLEEVSLVSFSHEYRVSYNRIIYRGNFHIGN